MSGSNIEDKILRQAEEAFLRRGLRVVTMSDLAMEMGMSKKTLYRHFATKEELVCAVVRSFLGREHCLMEQIGQEAGNAIEEMFLVAGHVIGLFRRLSPNRILELKRYYSSAWELIEGLHFERIREMIANNLAWGVEQGLYRREVDSVILSRLYVQLTGNLVDELLFPADEFDRTDLFHQFIAYHMYGVVSLKGRKVLEKKLLAIGCIKPEERVKK